MEHWSQQVGGSAKEEKVLRQKGGVTERGVIIDFGGGRERGDELV